MKTALALLAFLMLAASPARARDCTNPATQADITACAGEDEAGSDAALNASYKALFAMLAPADQARLRDAQRAWIVFRDKECAFRTSPYSDGSIAPALQARCLADLTAQRAAQLRAQVGCKEGDMACPPHVDTAAPAATPAPTKATGGTCLSEFGKAKAQVLADQCLQVSAATHPPCNIQNPCAMMVDEVRNGCAASGKDAPAFCAAYPPH